MAKKTTIFERGAFDLGNLQEINKIQAQQEPTEKESVKEFKYTMQALMLPADIEKYQKLYAKFVLLNENGNTIFKKDFFFILLKAYANYLKEKGLYKTPSNRGVVPNLIRRLGRRQLKGEKKKMLVFALSQREEEYNLLDDVFFSLTALIDDIEDKQNQSSYYMAMIDYFDSNVDKIVADYNKNPEAYEI